MSLTPVDAARRPDVSAIAPPLLHLHGRVDPENPELAVGLGPALDVGVRANRHAELVHQAIAVMAGRPSRIAAPEPIAEQLARRAGDLDVVARPSPVVSALDVAIA